MARRVELGVGQRAGRSQDGDDENTEKSPPPHPAAMGLAPPPSGLRLGNPVGLALGLGRLPALTTRRSGYGHAVGRVDLLDHLFAFVDAGRRCRHGSQFGCVVLAVGRGAGGPLGRRSGRRSDDGRRSRSRRRRRRRARRQQRRVVVEAVAVTDDGPGERQRLGTSQILGRSHAARRRSRRRRAGRRVRPGRPGTAPGRSAPSSARHLDRRCRPAPSGCAIVVSAANGTWPVTASTSTSASE